MKVGNPKSHRLELDEPPLPLKAMIRLLIVEDQIDLAKNIFEFLGDDEYTLDFAPDGLTALHLVASNTYDVIVLDIMLPGVSGYDICQRIRRDLKSQTPIILLTALGSISDKELGYGHGADDYLVKPFDLRELQLRIQSLHRRNTNSSDQLVAGAIDFNPGTLVVRYAGSTTELTGTSAKLFEILIRAYPRFVNHTDLTTSIWGESIDEFEGSRLRTHVYALRKALKQKFGEDLIGSIHGRGYRLTPPDEKSQGMGIKSGNSP